jgi:hypothetical protein
VAGPIGSRRQTPITCCVGTGEEQPLLDPRVVVEVLDVPEVRDDARKRGMKVGRTVGRHAEPMACGE